MKKIIVPAVMTVVIIISILGILAGLGAINNYCDSKNMSIELWSDKALKYQSEAMNLRHDNKDLEIEIGCLDNQVSGLLDNKQAWEGALGLPKICLEFLPKGYGDLWAEEHLKSNDSFPQPKSKIKLSIVEVISKVKPGVVHIMCPQWQGSGFIIGPNLIVSARHLSEDVEDFDITTHDGHKLHATRAISSEKHDITFIYIDNLTCVSEKAQEIECKKVNHKVKLHVLELGSIKECKLGQEIITIGSPYGKVNFNSVTLGIISGLDRDYDELNNSGYYGEQDYGWSVAFQTDSPGHPGNSGCPVFTADGIIRGILVGGFSPSLIIAIPVDTFLEDIEAVKLMFKLGKFYEEKQITQEEIYQYILNGWQ